MLEHYFGDLAPQVMQARHGELLAMAEREHRIAADPAHQARWSRRMLAGLGTRLIAVGQLLAHAGDARHPDLGQTPCVEDALVAVAHDWRQQ